MSRFSEWMQEENEKFHRLEFDIPDRESLGDFYDTYRIFEKEEIQCIVDRGNSSSLRPDISTLVISDQAIYTHPRVPTPNGDNRIPLATLSQFIIYQDTRRVRLRNQLHEYEIYGQSALTRDDIGAELVRFLRFLQAQMIRWDQDAKRVFDANICHCLEVIRENLNRSGLLDSRDLNLLDIIRDESEYAGEATMLALEHYYRLCDEGGYLRYLLAQKEYISEETIDALQKPDEFFFDNYIRVLSDVEGFVMSEAMIGAYLNLKKKPKLNETQALLLCYLCVRMDDMRYLDEILGLIGNIVSERNLWKLQDFLARYRHAGMRNVYAKLLSGDRLFPTELEMCDDLGLTPLHYALLTRNAETVRKILPLAKWTETKSPFPKDKIIDTVYDYNLLAVMLFEDRELIEEVFTATNPKAQPLVRSIHQMNVLIDINEGMKEREPEHAKRYENKKKEYVTMKREMETELCLLAEKEAIHLYEKAAIVRDIGHPFASYVLEFIDTPEAVMTRTAGMVFGHKLYRYKHLFFVAPTYVKRDLSYYMWEDHEIKETSVRKQDATYHQNEETVHTSFNADGDLFTNPEQERLYREQRKKEAERKKRREEFYRRQEQMRKEIEREEANEQVGWFSKGAHRDITLLKQEYRLLVKQYHPDATKSNRTAGTLQEIMSERARILERMAQ